MQEQGQLLKPRQKQARLINKPSSCSTSRVLYKFFLKVALFHSFGTTGQTFPAACMIWTDVCVCLWQFSNFFFLIQKALFESQESLWYSKELIMLQKVVGGEKSHWEMHSKCPWISSCLKVYKSYAAKEAHTPIFQQSLLHKNVSERPCSLIWIMACAWPRFPPHFSYF